MPKLTLLATVLVCLLLAPFVAGADDAKPAADRKGAKDAKSDKDLVQGRWLVVKRVKNGEAEDVKEHPVTLTFAGDTLTQARAGSDKKTTGGYTLDPAKSPKRITMTGKDGDHAGQAFEGIYELSGDTLKIAYSIGEKAKTAPTDFTGGKDAGLLVLERQRGE